LLYVGWRFLAGSLNVKWWRAVVIYSLAIVTASTFVFPISAALTAIRSPILLIQIPLVLLAQLCLTWLLVKGLTHLSFAKAFLAWLPTLGAKLAAFGFLFVATSS